LHTRESKVGAVRLAELGDMAASHVARELELEVAHYLLKGLT